MKTAQENILDFLKSNPSKWASGALQRMEWRNRNNTLATPRSIVRRLEELAEEGLIEVSYEGKNAQYQIKGEHRKKVQVVEQLANGSVRITYQPV
jgi:DNA-binding transcriptional ArsR family regulator